jgi:PTS system N-acetylgalactosamine-specific IIA component
MSSVRAIVAGHGEFAAGLVSAVVQITGRDDVFAALSNRGRSAQDVEQLLREQVERHGVSVVFTDLPAGSCTMAARRLQREHPTLVVVTGVNLAALLDFVFAEGDDGAAAGVAAEKGRGALVLTSRPGAPKPSSPAAGGRGPAGSGETGGSGGSGGGSGRAD